MSILAVYVVLGALPALSTAYSFEFTNEATQCQDLSLKITGDGGRPPYEVLIVTHGPQSPHYAYEVRRVTRHTFNEDSTSFKLPWPADSAFVAVLSDASGFGTGGTSDPVSVKSSPDSSCFDVTKTVEPTYYFHLTNGEKIIQCESSRIWWEKSKVQGQTQFQVVVPAGDSSTIPIGNISDIKSGTGFDWMVNIRSDTPIVLVAGDERGIGTAGCQSFVVSAGANDTCIDANSPKQTPGLAAGRSVQPNKASSTNVGAIAGGVVGGVIALAIIILVALFFFRRQKWGRGHQVDLLQGDEGDGNQNRLGLPQHYHPEPFIIPNSRSTSGDDQSGGRRSMSQVGSSDGLLGSTATSKTRSRSPLHAVNVIQHDDAGPPDMNEAETVEVPPAYNKLRR